MKERIKRAIGEKLLKRLADANEQLKQFKQRVTEAEAVVELLKTRPVLVSIEAINGKNVFMFVRNGHAYRIETYNAWDDDLQQWRKDLLE